MRLFIIGNGFDLAHGLKTSFYDFRKFLLNAHPDFLSQFEDNYYYPYDENNKKNKDILWNSFEENLSKIDADSLMERTENIDIGEGYGIQDTLYYWMKDQLSFIDNLEKYLREWIQSVKIRDLVPITSQMTNDAKYVTFNYTGVLERIYYISDENILHIHGALRGLDNKLIVGHNDKSIIEANVLKIEKAKNEFDERHEASCRAINDYYRATYKNTDAIMPKLLSFLQNADIEEVSVAGESIGYVDRDYFRKIDELNDNIQWIVYYYNKNEEERLKQNLISCGVDEKMIKLERTNLLYDLK